MSSTRVRSAVAEELDWIADLLNAQGAGPVTAEEMRRADEFQPSDWPAWRPVAVDQHGALQGTARVWRRGSTIWCWVRVDEARRGRGVGAVLYDSLESYVRGRGADSLQAMVRDDAEPGLSWAARLGFQVQAHEVGFRLDLANRADGLCDETEPGAQIHPWSELASRPEAARQLYELHREIHAHPATPGHVSSPFPVFETWQERLQQPEGLFIACDGERMIGFTICEHDLMADELFTTYTGVLPGYRGRRLATALKQRTIQYAYALGARYLASTTDASNDAMQRLFNRFGFERVPGWVILHKRLA